jgi:prepilin-type N-terminal cleavage/methylation domain-containing protein/prepilin-type processing-associated H-X9-DG protein
MCRAHQQRRGPRGFTLIEVMVTVAIIAVLVVTALVGYGKAAKSIRKGRSISNLRQMVMANQTYAAAHDGYFCPAQDRRNRTRWHGGRPRGSGPFDPTKGFLSPYMGDSGNVESCPEFVARIRNQKEVNSFEMNSGGYGYNASYIGGTPMGIFEGTTVDQVPNPSRTIMFTTTALAKTEGLQEYPFSEPFYATTRSGSPGMALQPSTHFRFDGSALVAWCDGHVTVEPNPRFKDINYYGGNNQFAEIGWFGPEEENGYWNPNSPAASGDTTE